MARSLAATIRAANAALIEDGDLDAIGRYFTPDYVARLTRKDLKGHAAIRRWLLALRRGFAGLRVEVEILSEGKGRIAWQRTLSGAHRGSFRGFPATGRRMVWRDLHVTRFRGGRIAEEWVVSDLAERLLLSTRRPPSPVHDAPPPGFLAAMSVVRRSPGNRE